MKISVEGEKDGITTEVDRGGKWGTAWTLENDELDVERVEEAGGGKEIEHKTGPTKKPRGMGGVGGGRT